MTIDMVKNPLSGTYEYRPEPRFRLRDLLTPGVFDLLVVTGFVAFVLTRFFF